MKGKSQGKASRDKEGGEKDTSFKERMFQRECSMQEKEERLKKSSPKR